MFFSKLKMKLYALLRRLGLIKGVYYIGSAETLPPPMTAEEESEVIAHIDDEPSLRRVLVERNLRLVVFIARRFENTGMISLLSLTRIAMALGCAEEIKKIFTEIPYNSIEEVINENK